MAMAVGEREVGRIVRHGVTLGLDAHADIGEREVGGGSLGDGYRLDTVALMVVHCFQCIVKFHIRVERVVLGSRLLLGRAVVERCRHLCLVREELAQFDIGRNGIRLKVVGRTLHDALFQSAEAFGDNLTRQIE